MNQENLQVTTANINGLKDCVEIIKNVYHMPDRDSHVYTSTYVDNILGNSATEIFKLTHQQFSDRYKKRDFLMDFPAGYLVEKLDDYLRQQNMPATQIEYGNWPTIKWLKEMIR